MVYKVIQVLLHTFKASCSYNIFMISNYTQRFYRQKMKKKNISDETSYFRHWKQWRKVVIIKQK